MVITGNITFISSSLCFENANINGGKIIIVTKAKTELFNFFPCPLQYSFLTSKSGDPTRAKMKKETAVKAVPKQINVRKDTDINSIV